MFDWMMRKSDLKEAQLREARLKRLAKVLEVPDQESFTNRAFLQPRIGFATEPMVGVDSRVARPDDWPGLCYSPLRKAS